MQRAPRSSPRPHSLAAGQGAQRPRLASRRRLGGSRGAPFCPPPGTGERKAPGQAPGGTHRAPLGADGGGHGASLRPGRSRYGSNGPSARRPRHLTRPRPFWPFPERPRAHAHKAKPPGGLAGTRRPSLVCACARSAAGRGGGERSLSRARALRRCGLRSGARRRTPFGGAAELGTGPRGRHFVGAGAAAAGSVAVGAP